MRIRMHIEHVAVAVSGSIEPNEYRGRRLSSSSNPRAEMNCRYVHRRAARAHGGVEDREIRRSEATASRCGLQDRASRGRTPALRAGVLQSGSGVTIRAEVSFVSPCVASAGAATPHLWLFGPVPFGSSDLRFFDARRGRVRLDG